MPVAFRVYRRALVIKKYKDFIKSNHLHKGSGAPERIRTSDRSVRSRVLYPAELRALKKVAEREGFEPSVPVLGTVP
jgi:hypothetical protein